MDHAEALELIEIAAAEPGGIERLAAGDTPEASLVAGHLAGCPSCADSLVRVARTAERARAAIRELPDPALRERTLSFVRAVGRDRSGVASGSSAAGGGVAGRVIDSSPAARVPAVAASAPAVAFAPALVPPPRIAPSLAVRPRRPWFMAGLAAAVVVAAVLGFVAGGAGRVAPEPGDEVAHQAAVIAATMRIATQPDAAHVILASSTGGAAKGTILYSRSSGELAMVVTGLAPPSDGATYACWIETAGTKRRIGVVYADGGLGSWAGPVSGLASLAPGATFGVSLVPAGSDAGTPVLTGG